MPLKLNSTGGGSVTLDTPSTAGTYTVTVPATNQTLGITSGTAVASTSGTSIDFTGIPSWVKRITVMFSGVSTSGTSNLLIQIGSGSVTTSGYTGSASQQTGSVTASFTSGFIVGINTGALDALTGICTIVNVSGNLWVESSVMGLSANGPSNRYSAGQVTLSGTLDRVRITTVNGTDTFDAGTINIMYEG